MRFLSSSATLYTQWFGGGDDLNALAQSGSAIRDLPPFAQSGFVIRGRKTLGNKPSLSTGIDTGRGTNLPSFARSGFAVRGRKALGYKPFAPSGFVIRGRKALGYKPS
jgi:hypothetical protein